MVEIGLELVAGNANLTFIFFVGLALLTVLGVRFAYYAFRNRAQTELEMQAPIWSHLLYIGLFAALYGAVGLLEIITSLDVPYKSVPMLATTLLLAFAIRQIHYTATSADGGAAQAHPSERFARAAFVAVVIGQAVLLFEFGISDLTATVESLGALAFLGYGLVFYRDQISTARLQGTMLDSLLRHLLPVLAFAALVGIVNLADPFGLDRIVILHVQVVFIIMTATAMMTATIKLRQNLAGL
ncbi:MULTISPECIES: hypothetical protein [Salinibaculum]|uniref:hypothetical protein n=1 Tax=Salinibaculum TaxID=2732368 RepID=UPI0030D4CA7F